MKIMIDTNVLISAILKRGSVPDIVLTDVCEKHELVLCNQIISESYAVAERDFPDKIRALQDLFAELRFELVSVPGVSRIRINDIKDQPILNAAITHNLDILITGDRHFLELDQEILQVITPAEYKKKYI